METGRITFGPSGPAPLRPFDWTAAAFEPKGASLLGETPIDWEAMHIMVDQLSSLTSELRKLNDEREARDLVLGFLVSPTQISLDFDGGMLKVFETPARPGLHDFALSSLFYLPTEPRILIDSWRQFAQVIGPADKATNCFLANVEKVPRSYAFNFEDLSPENEDLTLLARHLIPFAVSFSRGITTSPVTIRY